LDVLIAVTLTSFLVFLLASFVSQVIQFKTYFVRHQQIRSEGFALVNNTLPTLIREAVAIDYTETTPDTLVLFVDKREKKRVKVYLEPLAQVSADDTRQLVLEGPSGKVYLNSQNTVVDEFEVGVTDDPRVAQDVAQARANQPMVSVRVAVRHQRPESARGRQMFGFFEDPRVSYQAAYTLRNYSFSSLRSS